MKYKNVMKNIFIQIIYDFYNCLNMVNINMKLTKYLWTGDKL